MDRTPINDVRTKIDQTPDEGVPALQAAYDQVRAKRFSQIRICSDLNKALKQVGLGEVSFSAFNRWAQAIRRGDARRPLLPASALPLDKQAMRALSDELKQVAERLLQIGEALLRLSQ